LGPKGEGGRLLAEKERVGREGKGVE
jgi:hypothetical protein